MTIAFDFSKLSPHITNDTLILTPNSRTQKAIIAGQLIDSFSVTTSNDEAKEIKRVVKALNILSFSQWQENLWQEFSFVQPMPKKIPSIAVKNWLEKQVKNESEWTLTNPSGVASKVMEAYQNLLQWDLSITAIPTNESPEIEYFKLWVTRFEIFCQEKSLCADFACMSIINNLLFKDTQAFEQITEQFPKHLLLVGFNHITPLEELFFKNLTGLGITIKQFEFSTKAKQANRIDFNSLQDELDFAASYAFKYRSEAKSIGVVVEQLAGNLAEVHRSFSRIFHPEEEKPWVSIGKPEYNVSAGFSLAEQPIIKTALSILRFNPNRISLDELHLLKNTPFIDWGNEIDEVRFFLHQLCLSPRKNYSIEFLKKSIDESDVCERLSFLKEALLFIEKRETKKQPVEKHLTYWKELLDTWGWACSEDLNDFENSAKELFFSLMDECHSLTCLYETIHINATLDFLNQLAQQQSFQIASDRTNVHVLGVLEAAGLPFDHLLVIGFNQKNWPQRNKLNPFIPLNIQRELNMPGSSAEREYEYAKSLSNSLMFSAEHILVTSSDIDGSGDNTSLVAPFFNHLKESSAYHFIEKIQEKCLSTDYSWHEDSYIATTSDPIRGGAYLLSEYAQCPFKSIANFRLKLRGYQQPEIGVEPRIKGAWLHDAMELVWKKLQSQQELIEIDEPKLVDLVTFSLETALEKHKAYLLAMTAQEVVHLEFNKLLALMLEWLCIEKQRDYFNVEKLEVDYSLCLESIELKFRVDRIDTDNQGNIQIIDYKTGKTEISHWFGVRPTEAQMPAYILALNEQTISSLNYARIKTGEVAQIGLNFSPESKNISSFKRGNGEYEEKPVKSLGGISTNELFKQWEITLKRISIGISSGYMPVSPKDESKSCQYCDYQSICRIGECQPDERQLEKCQSEELQPEDMPISNDDPIQINDRGSVIVKGELI